MSRPFRITFVHPCIGKRPGARYLKTWQMEPLPVAVLAGLTPPGVERRFYDDRLEEIPFDEPTDLVAISTEVYTARRAYQIASAYRRRGVPVVLGGFHATLLPDEALRFGESVVVGEAEDLWAQVVDDHRAGTPRKRYQAERPSDLVRANPDRSIYADKRYLPIGLVEAGRGCPFTCEFCAIQSFHRGGYRRRPVDSILAELREIRDRSRLVFFVDDNIVSDPRGARELLEALVPLKLRWVSQGSINAALDPDLLGLLRRSGCEGLLIGFESLDSGNLRQMNKGVNLAQGDYERAMANLRQAGIRVYGTFVFGYDGDTPDTFASAFDFAVRHGFYLCGFNHLLPMPGTPLYARFEAEGRLRYDAWWLDPDYRYNTLAFHPKGMSARDLEAACLEVRRRFYGLRSLLRRALHPVNRQDWMFLQGFFALNLLHRAEVVQRHALPLGDPTDRSPLLEACR